MTRNQANRYLADRGFPDLEISKADGVWHIVGGHDDPRISDEPERCLHVCRLEEVTASVIERKLGELVSGVNTN